MAIPLGEHEMTVVRHGIYKNDNDKSYIGVTFTYEGEECNSQVWITDKSVGMARKALKKLGFDIKQRSVMVLNEDQTLLAGAKCMVNVYEDDYGGKVKTKYEIILRDDLMAGDELDSVAALIAGEEKVEKPKAKPPPAKRTPKPDPNEASYKQAEENVDSVESF